MLWKEVSIIKRYLNWFLKLFDVIAISSGASRSSMRIIRERLDNGEVVALFPEGHITYNGQLSEFKKGYEMILKDSFHFIVPFLYSWSLGVFIFKSR